MIKENQMQPCPRCGDNKDFVLKNTDFFTLSPEEKNFIRELYTEELCVPCIMQLRVKFQIKNIPVGFRKNEG